MTPERITEARKRACRHLMLTREQDEDTGLYADWMCLDCGQYLQLSAPVGGQPSPGIDEVFDEVLKQWVRH